MLRSRCRVAGARCQSPAPLEPDGTISRHPAQAQPAYRTDLEARWWATCHNAAELARALIRAGADVRPRVGRDWAMKRRQEEADVLDAAPSPPRWRPPSADRTARFLQADPSTLSEVDRRFLAGLRAEAPVLVEIAALVICFAALVRRRSHESVEAWLMAASATLLAKFAGLQHDVEALRGTLTTPWSTGPVEGQIGRLKMLKRTMFGRAGFALLRQRVLARP